MSILYKNQYNIEMDKIKMLSTEAGVGSIITTKFGTYVMPLSIDKWEFIQELEDAIAQRTEQALQNYIAYDYNHTIIDDSRFVEYLKDKEGYNSIRFLVDIPHVKLSGSNRYDTEEKKSIIPARHFPRWFKNRQGELKLIGHWEQQFPTRKQNLFAPPKDYQDSYKNRNGDERYKQLIQVPMVFICEDGHISDIPWDKLFVAALEHNGMQGLRDVRNLDLLGYPLEDCPEGGKHEIHWYENRNQSESWGVLKCSKCGQTVSLEGIMNIKTKCRGDKPWQGVRNATPYHCNNEMRVALVTSNSIYYANRFSSIYIPMQLVTRLSNDAQWVLNQLTNPIFPDWESRNQGGTRIDFWNENFSTYDIMQQYDVFVDRTITREDYEQIKNIFCMQDANSEYRYVEYCAFNNNSVLPDNCQQYKNKLDFSDVEISDRHLSKYFNKIQQVDMLSVTSIQLNFYRVAMPQAELRNGQISYPTHGQTIHNRGKQDVKVLPAIQTYGEGLFFSFKEEQINDWIDRMDNSFRNRYRNINLSNDDMNSTLYQEMKMGGVEKFYMLHTFSHIIIKELEFMCGYPSASLKERLYFGVDMCGVLIYTEDGAAGGMGGLVWQGQVDNIEKIIKSALRRATECSSDPICWENDQNQLNFAACFSCCMLSETSCEKRNVGLDRRVLVDPKFGFFDKDFYM